MNKSLNDASKLKYINSIASLVDVKHSFPPIVLVNRINEKEMSLKVCKPYLNMLVRVKCEGQTVIVPHVRSI